MPLLPCPLWPETLPWPIQIFYSSLFTTFIQLSTCYYHFFLANFNHIFFHLYWFLFGVNPSLCNWFLTVQLKTTHCLSSYQPICFSFASTHLFFICFLVNFTFSTHIALNFLSWHFDVFHGLSVCFSFSKCLNFFIFVPNFRHSRLRTAHILCHIPLWIAFLNEFFNPFHFFNWQFFSWSHVSFLLDSPNHLLIEVYKNCLPTVDHLEISRLLLVFVLGRQITRSWHNFFPLTLDYSVIFSSAWVGKKSYH